MRWQPARLQRPRDKWQHFDPSSIERLRLPHLVRPSFAKTTKNTLTLRRWSSRWFNQRGKRRRRGLISRSPWTQVCMGTIPTRSSWNRGPQFAPALGEQRRGFSPSPKALYRGSDEYRRGFFGSVAVCLQALAPHFTQRRRLSTSSINESAGTLQSFASAPGSVSRRVIAGAADQQDIVLAEVV